MGCYILETSALIALCRGLHCWLIAPRPNPVTLRVVRRERIRVPAGSVGIGGSQTGIYPAGSPGGWQIIGRTDERLFRPELDPPTLLHIGDRVRFVAMEDA